MYTLPDLIAWDLQSPAQKVSDTKTAHCRAEKMQTLPAEERDLKDPSVSLVISSTKISSCAVKKLTDS